MICMKAVKRVSQKRGEGGGRRLRIYQDATMNYSHIEMSNGMNINWGDANAIENK